MPPWVWWGVLAVNALTFVLFGWDKLCSRRGWRRIREATLLWAMFATGCIGGWCAMSVFRHKTRKAPFRWRALAATLVNPLWLLAARQFGWV